MVVVKLWTFAVNKEPPSSGANSRAADIATNSQVSEEEPARNERIRGATGRTAHDIQIGRIETQGSGRETVSHQVNPQQLDWNQSLGQTQSSRQENTNDCQKDKKQITSYSNCNLVSVELKMTNV